MKYMLMFLDGPGKMDPTDPRRQEIYQRIGQWWERLSREGKIVGGEELQPASTATTVRFNGEQPAVTDGPFMEAKESIGGYALVEVADLDEALAIAKTWPLRHTVEVRPVVEGH